MSFTQSDLDELESLLASGELEVRHGDKSVRFDSREDLMARIAYVRRALQPAGTHYTHGVIRFRSRWGR